MPNDDVAHAGNASKGLTPDAISKLTLPEIFAHLTIGSWIALATLLASAYSAGVGSANWGFIQSLFAKPTSVTPVKEFVSKAILEKSRYTVEASTGRLTLDVREISIARQVMEVDAGPEGGVLQHYKVPPNSMQELPIGSHVYELVVHDLARASVGQDIAVVSIKERKP